MTKEQAIELFESGWWEGRPAEEVARWQLQESRLCMPLGEFHKAVEEALDRSVWTHEFAGGCASLLAELDGDEPKPENLNQHAVDSLAALLLSHGKDPDETMVVLEACNTPDDTTETP